MVNESIRIRTTPGVNKNISVKLEQDFNFLEILSLKISQEDIYSSFCANYGVVVGRVISNKGFGIPNVKVSVFIPISDEDQKNQIIKDLYPYKTAFQKNSQNIRYNLLPSKTTCVLNKPVGTFPTKEDVLDNNIILEIFDKYYKYTTTTNNSGDYMIFGVPTGQQTVHMDVDLSDIGAFSVRPYDLIASGFPERLFESSAEFKTSTNLDSLPQIKSFNSSINVIPFWGEPGTCEIGINRVDYDTGVELIPNALFFGSIFTDSDETALSTGCIPDNDQGAQNYLKTGAGIMNMVRVKSIDPKDWSNGQLTPTQLEFFDIEGGDLIDDDGTFSLTLPMNIGHVVTDEFGVLVPSPNPSVGVATKAMYRFKMRFVNQINGDGYRTGTMFFPSLGRDFGGTLGIANTGNLTDANGTEDQRWTDNICEYNLDKNKCGGVVYNQSRLFLDFHSFEWKQLYTIAHYIKKYKKGFVGGGTRFSFLGIKNTDVTRDVNPFPFNNAVWKFSIVYYVIAFFAELAAFFIRLLIVLVSLCIGFCVLFRFGFSVFGYTFNWTFLNACTQICLFKWLVYFFPKLPGGGRGFKLSCEGLGSNDGVEIDLTNCVTNGFCSTGSPCITACGNDNICFNISLGISGIPDGNQNSCTYALSLGTTGVGINQNCAPNTCLKSVQAWLCCVKVNTAEDSNVIRRNFNDAWVFGTSYLFNFEYENDGNEQKFCGPGSEGWRGDNYKGNKCCLDTSANNECDRCLVRGFNDTANAGIFGSFDNYHRFFHNEAKLREKIGSLDVNDVVYCNSMYSTKIVSLGRVEMCLDTLNDIENAIKASQALNVYTQKPNFYTGTFYENGWDPGYWVRSLKETSYNNPKKIINYLALKADCDLDSMFIDTNAFSSLFAVPIGATYVVGLLGNYLNSYCHDFEFNDDQYYVFKEISKFQNTIQLSPDQYGGLSFDPAQDSSQPAGVNLISNTPKVVTNTTYTPGVHGGFRVSKYPANRFSPCGNNGNCSPSIVTAFNNSTSGLWDGGNSWPGIGTPPYQDLSNNKTSFDSIINYNYRNNQNSRTNIPYYYFGLNPGKTAINKLRKKFFIEK